MAVIYCDGLVVRAGCEDTAVVVDSGGYEFLSVGCVGEIGRAGRIWDVSVVSNGQERIAQTYGPVCCAIAVLKPWVAKCELLRQTRCDAFEGHQTRKVAVVGPAGRSR